MDTEYRKGSLCIHRPLICQEGYCSECEIHTKKAQAIISKLVRHIKGKSHERDVVLTLMA
jgi:hypothetical protein